MKRIIAELWNGNIAPIENFGKKNAEMEGVVRLLTQNEEKLASVLTESQQTIFQKYSCCVDEYASLVAEQAFHDGFCLASGLLIEALSGDS